MSTNSCTTAGTCWPSRVTDRRARAPMMKTLLVRGMLAGLIAGVLAFGFAYAFGEPSVNTAIGLEESGGHEHSHDAGAAPAPAAEEPELVPRDIQSTVGLLTGVVVYGVAIGGLLSLAF